MLRIGSLTIIGSVSLGLLFACGDKINPRGDYTTEGAAGAPGTLDGGQMAEAGVPASFTYDILPLLKKECACHVSGGVTPLLDTFAAAKANANASMQAIVNGTMPVGLPPLSTSEKELFQSWINAGMPNN